ncbi:CPBP family intramembrane glutamic endopeptidase [Nostoc sp. TCL26-01]|uniref:CPBP family intramembrane glutamic endopeptidase n=1 Tax=Nostoc sp. TCL26-01 TaxID=2576904 RepID=UPI0015B8997A|nr:type II CAAX endopeptidase family protein [Nostoc sp. TCL26-01]QLE54950.1 CPBP family intramembrane metalloprotease [Nostoc sp. TCL26-01]
MAASGYEKIKVTLIIGALYIFPVASMLVGFIPFGYRFLLLIIVFILVILSAMVKNLNLQELGFADDNLLPALRDILPITLGFIVLITLRYFLQGTRVDNSTLQWYFYLFFIFISAPIQEFLYRGYLLHLVSKLGFSQYFLAISSILYSFVHAIYWDLTTVLLTLIIGFIWGYHYIRFKNLYSVTLSHILLGLVALKTGLL